MTLSQSDMYTLAKSVGLSDSRAKVASAIGMAESGGDPNVHNTNASTGDDSYGLWQINMLGSMGPSRRKQFGISDNSQLYDPQINAKAMAALSQGGGNFSAWTTYTTVDPKRSYQRFMGNTVTPTTTGGASGSNWVDKILPGSPISTAESFAQGFNKMSAWVSNSDNWVRVGYVAGGAVIVIAGLVMILGDTKAGQVATGLAPTGKVTKTVKSASKVPGGAAPVKGSL